VPRNRENSKVKVTLCERAPRLPALLSLITFQFHPLVVSLSDMVRKVLSWCACHLTLKGLKKLGHIFTQNLIKLIKTCILFHVFVYFPNLFLKYFGCQQFTYYFFSQGLFKTTYSKSYHMLRIGDRSFRYSFIISSFECHTSQDFLFSILE